MQAEMEELIKTNGDSWKQQAMEADALEGFKTSTHYTAVEELIFKEIEKMAFATLKSPNLDMTDLNQLYQIRALSQAVDLIRKKIDQKIEQGRAARFNLKKMNSTLEGGRE